MTNTEAHPECTGRQLRDYLSSTGTGASRIELCDKMLAEKPSLSGKLLLEQLIAANVQKGTLEKAGRFVYGPTFNLPQGGPSAATDEIQTLRGQVANLEQHIRGLEAKSGVQGTELIGLRTENARLSEDLRESVAELKAARGQLEAVNKELDAVRAAARQTQANRPAEQQPATAAPTTPPPADDGKPPAQAGGAASPRPGSAKGNK